MKEETRSIPTVGISSLLVIFAVLCLVVFALLSMATVRADVRLSEKSRAAVTAYYEADCRAEEILAQLRSGAVPEGVREQNGIYAYECPISETQSLFVEVRVAGDSYQILRWQAQSTQKWQENDTLPVWQGE